MADPASPRAGCLAALRRDLAHGEGPGRGDEDSVRRQWWAALATLQEDFLMPLGPQPGVWLAAPLPALYEPALLQQLQGWVWAPSELGDLLQASAPLLPATGVAAAAATAGGGFERLPLEEADGTDPLLVLITPRLQGEAGGHGRQPFRQPRPKLRHPLGVVLQGAQGLDRLAQPLGLGGVGALQALIQPRQRRRERRRLKLHHQPPGPVVAHQGHGHLQPLVHRASGGGRSAAAAPSSELALLEALTHEVRTPLATIRTLIRSLLRRSDLPDLVRQRLQQIDGECSEQIDRFGLIFLAAELQRQPAETGDQHLARTDLAQLLVRLEPLWRQQLQRRSLALELRAAADLPPVLSDPARLETVLGGLVDRFSRGLPAGAVVALSLRPAGARLKLRLSASADAPGAEQPGGGAERVGPVLSWNPGTGSLQLSRQATQRLFHSLGGRLAERSGNALTVFFPVAGA